MKDLRPISLCNVIYKLVSKCISNRMKVVLNYVIDQAQCAFVPDRLITDNALIAFKSFHAMKYNRSMSRGVCALKLDMSKAYERVEWGFVERLLLLMDCPTSFIQLILNCISSVSFSFLINGVPKGFVKPMRGLRQGDPISPYLFLICAEGLSAMIRNAELNNSLNGFRICHKAPNISTSSLLMTLWCSLKLTSKSPRQSKASSPSTKQFLAKW